MAIVHLGMQCCVRCSCAASNSASQSSPRVHVTRQQQCIVRIPTWSTDRQVAQLWVLVMRVLLHVNRARHALPATAKLRALIASMCGAVSAVLVFIYLGAFVIGPIQIVHSDSVLAAFSALVELLFVMLVFVSASLVVRMLFVAAWKKNDALLQCVPIY